MILAIESCHKLGFIHRDIKPDVSDWIRTPFGEFRLSDCLYNVSSVLIEFSLRSRRAYQIERLRTCVSSYANDVWVLADDALLTSQILL